MRHHRSRRLAAFALVGLLTAGGVAGGAQADDNRAAPRRLWALLLRHQGERTRAQCRLADEIRRGTGKGEVATGRDGPGAGVFNGNAKAKGC